jgi:hypothetical protein
MGKRREAICIVCEREVVDAGVSNLRVAPLRANVIRASGRDDRVLAVRLDPVVVKSK